MEDMLEGREEVMLRFDREELYQLMLIAHEQDITLNQLIENVLIEYIEKHKERLSLETNHEDL